MPKGRIDELLGMVALGDRAKDKVSGYSLGMKQRLGIAAALLNDPKLLLLDEPANGLDPAGIVGMRDTLRALAASGKTVFVSSHILSEIQQMADVVGIIGRGRLIREGTVESLLREEGSIRIRVGTGEVATAAGILALRGRPGLRDARGRARGRLADGPGGSRALGRPQPGPGGRRRVRVAHRGRGRTSRACSSSSRAPSPTSLAARRRQGRQGRGRGGDWSGGPPPPPDSTGAPS